ncbi:hypothetical protein B0H17DRAFT_1145359 [Mycena rosella]|uniref:Uncharacterized protein n=1 Tax=Mycena rosella TaxID=1033263 RepID=A0AAD7CRF1_MYCRO|nr:hypothetical protein B0H17DRAFT_1145359 [Mycena rosella]
MSVQDLQARIEAVSADIARQKEVLKKLEHSKNVLQRQLNAVRVQARDYPLKSRVISLYAAFPANRSLGLAISPCSSSISATLGQISPSPLLSFGRLSTSISRARKASMKFWEPG